MASDAMYSACAESANADYFLTCDDKFIKKAEKTENLKTEITTLSDLINKEIYNV